MKRMPRWIKDAVWRRDGGRCAFLGRDGQPCGRTTELFIEDLDWTPPGVWDPDYHRLTCLYHLAGGEGLHEVDWASAARA